MGSMSIWHWAIVAVIVLLLFGGRGKLSGIMGDAAKGIKESGVELWLLDVQSKVARKLSNQPLSGVSGRGFSWMPDSKTLLVQLKPAKLGAAPAVPALPMIRGTRAWRPARKAASTVVGTILPSIRVRSPLANTGAGVRNISGGAARRSAAVRRPAA